jgi:hypothetical protein
MPFQLPTGSNQLQAAAGTNVAAAIILLFMTVYKGLPLRTELLPSSFSIPSISDIMGENKKAHFYLYLVLFILVAYSAIMEFYQDE